MNTFAMNPSGTGLTQRVGYYNDYNGVFFEQDASGIMNMVIRSSSTGAVQPIEDRKPKSQWNQWTDSSPVLDPTKTQIFFIDIEWLGVGTVRTGFIINSIYYLAHCFYHANIDTTTYMTSARMAPRYEITYSGANLVNPYKLKQICSTVISEGGYEGRSIIRHAGINNISGITIPANATNNIQFAVTSIKLNDTSGNRGINGIVIPAQADILLYGANQSVNGVILYQLLLNTTISGVNPNTSYTPYNTLFPQDTTSSAMYWVNLSGSYTNASKYTVSGGTLVNAGYVSTNNTAILGSVNDFNLQIGRNLSGTNTGAYTSDTLTLTCNLLNVSNAVTLFGQLGWYEL
jgi:hypothetical protein